MFQITEDRNQEVKTLAVEVIFKSKQKINFSTFWVNKQTRRSTGIYVMTL